MTRKESMIEMFPNIDNIPLPAKALCQPEHVDAAHAQVRAAFAQLTNGLDDANGVPLKLFEQAMQQQQQ
jgi:hypothetical protein